MDVTHTYRIARSATAVTLAAAALAGCATQAATSVEPAGEPHVVVQLRTPIANDIDPRGHHGRLADSQQAPAHPRMPVIADIDPRGLHGATKAPEACAAAEVSRSGPPKNLSPINDDDPRGLHGLPAGPR